MLYLGYLGTAENAESSKQKANFSLEYAVPQFLTEG